MTSRTPRRDAVTAWIASGYQGDIPWPQERGWDDPPEWADYDVRLAAALMQCGGARAELPVGPNPLAQPVVRHPGRTSPVWANPLPPPWAPPWAPPEASIHDSPTGMNAFIPDGKEPPT